MKNDSRRVKIEICLNTGSEMAPCFQAVTESIRQFRNDCQRNATLRAVSTLSVVGYDCNIYNLQKPSPVSSDLELPGAPSPLEGQLYLRGLYECLREAASDSGSASFEGTELTVLIFLTNRLYQGIPGSHPALPVLVPSSILQQEKNGNLIFLPVGIDMGGNVSVLDALTPVPDWFMLPVSCAGLDDVFSRVRHLILRILTYAPGKAPKVDVYAQFASDGPLSYPVAPLQEFEPVVLGWDEVCGALC